VISVQLDGGRASEIYPVDLLPSDGGQASEVFDDAGDVDGGGAAG